MKAPLLFCILLAIAASGYGQENDVPAECPIVREWFVDWDASYQCALQLPVTEPFTTPGQILPLLSVSDIIRATGAAWQATNLIEAEGEVCVRILPQLTVSAGGGDVFSQYCDPVLTFLRNGVTFDAAAHCRLILDITGAVNSYARPIFPSGLYPEDILPGIDALRPFDILDHIEKIVYQILGVSFNEVDNICTAREGIVESESSLQEVVTDFLVEFTKILLPRAAEICNSWDDIVNVTSAISSYGPSSSSPYNETSVPDIDVPQLMDDVSSLVAHLAGYADRPALCEAVTDADSSPPDSSMLDRVVSDIVNNTLSILTDVQQCSNIVQESLDLSLDFAPVLTREALDLEMYQFTGFNKIHDICQAVVESFLPGGLPTPTPTSPGVQVRLFGGSNGWEGTVEVQYNGEWGTVCDDSWDLDDATVVCRMLGFDEASQAPRYARFGEGTGNILLDDVECTGDEANLADCQHRPFGENNCAHYEDAGVICSQQDATITDIRLVGGGTDSEGTVEIQYNGEWGTVCDDSWDVNDANVVCRMLGYDLGASQALTSAQFGMGSGKILLDDVECTGEELNLAECQHRAFGENNCGHYEDAGVICLIQDPTITDIRLVGGDTDSKGTVEIQYNGEWGTVCDDSWDVNDANVVCRMLGYDLGASDALSSAQFGMGSGIILLDDVECTGEELNLAECQHRAFGENNCRHAEDAGVICRGFVPTTTARPVVPSTQAPSIEDIRLVGGNKKSEGRLEILYEGQWGTVCDDVWSLDAAVVACKMLLFAGAIEATSLARFGQGTGPIILDNVVCSGEEKTLADCTHNEFFEHNCGHDEDAGVVCTDPGDSITCSTCMEMSSDTPDFQPPMPPNAVPCDNPVDMQCGEGVTSCMTIIMNINFLLNSESLTTPPLTIQQKHRQCGFTSAEGIYGDVCLSDDSVGSRYVDYIPNPGFGLDKVNIDTSICVCDSADGCTPPSADDELEPTTAAGGDSITCSTCMEMSSDTPDFQPPMPPNAVPCDNPVDMQCDEGVTSCMTIIMNINFLLNSESLTTPPLTIQQKHRQCGFTSAEGIYGDVCLSDDLVGSRYVDYIPDPGFGLDKVIDTSICVCDSADGCTPPSADDELEPTTAAGAETTPTPREVRLVDGNIPSRGRVEIRNTYGYWGSICDTDWTQRDADVVCKMLGYEGAWEYSNNAEYGESRTRIELDRVTCGGWENNLASCELHQNGGFCKRREEVGVACTLPDMPEFQIRLVNGSVPWEGRVELLSPEGEWGTICSLFWGNRDGDVACRMLGYNGAYEATSSNGYTDPCPFGEGTGDILLSDFGCTGDEENLADCSHSAWGDHNCYHYQDAGLICNNPEPEHVVVRLVNGSSHAEGRVEVLYEGEFGTICDDSWDINDAAVVCRSLGYEGASSAPNLARFGQGTGDILLDDVVCTGDEDNLGSCQHSGWGENNCVHAEDASAICNGELNLPVRLVNGPSPKEGRVEIFRYGAWGTVCDDFWDINDGNVVCRMLGYGPATRIWWGTTYGAGSGRILLDSVECTGSEATLDDCGGPPWGVHDCSHSEDAGVVCA